VILTLLAAGPVLAASPPAGGALSASANQDEDLVLMVTAGRTELSEGLTAVGRGKAVYLPLGELMRALDFAVSVDGKGNASGWVIREDRKFALDVDGGTVSVGGKTQALPPGAAIVRDDEIYVRTDLIEAWFPLKLTTNLNAAAVDIQGTEPLPFQAREERENRRLHLGARASPQDLDFEDTPYALFTPPALDIDAQLATGPSNPTNYQLRASGDLAWMSARLFATGDRRSALSSVRFDMSRQSTTGIGLFDLKQLDLGDVYSPALPNGIRSTSGRGVSFSNIAPGEAGLTNRADIRGELRDGWQAELYQNGILVASQPQGVNGQYNFASVPLNFGPNRFKVVMYGPHGEVHVEERTQDSRSSLAPGQFRYSAGVIATDTPLFDINVQDPVGFSDLRERGKLQIAAFADYGLTRDLAIGLHLGERPTGAKEIWLAGAGLRKNWSGAAGRVDVTGASDGSGAVSGAVLTQLWGFNVALEHAEYWNGFRDDARNLDNVELSSYSYLTADNVIQVLGSDVGLSFNARDRQRADGSRDINGGFRTTVQWSRLLVSGGLIYEDDNAIKSGQRSLMAEAGLSGPVFGGLGHFVADYSGEPNAGFRSVSASWDRYLGHDLTLRLSYDKALTEEKTDRVGASVSRRFKRFDAIFSAGYDSAQRSGLVGLRMSTSLGYTGEGYVFARPGLATGGSAAVRVFEDTNANGERDPGEPGVAGVRLDSGRGGQVVTDKNGLGLTQALGDGDRVGVAVLPGSIEDPFSRPEREGFSIEPRAGRRHYTEIGLVHTADIDSTVVFVGVAEKPVSNVEVELVDDGGAVGAEARSDFDGGLLFQGVIPGAWHVRLNPGQASRLGLVLLNPPTVTLRPDQDGVTLPTLKVVRQGSAEAVAAGATAGPEQDVVTIGDFTLRRVTLQGARSVDRKQLDGLWRPLIGKTLSLADLKHLAAQIEALYTSRGYPFVAAVVPPQDVRGGSVVIRVIEGRITDLTVLGRDTIARRQATQIFSPLLNRSPLSLADVEGAYQRARMIPGLVVAGTIRKGSKPGGMDLVIQAQRTADQFYANVNNLFPDAVGPWGAFFGADFNGGSRYGDRLSLQAYTSADFKEQTLGRLSYSRGLNHVGTVVSASVLTARANPKGDFSALDLATNVNAADFQITQPVVNYGSFGLTASGRLEATDQTTKVFSDVALSEDKLRIASLRFEGRFRWMEANGGFAVEVRKGLDIAGASSKQTTGLSRAGADPQAFVVRASGNAERAFAPWLSASLRVEGQYSRDSLAAPEEYSVGNLTIGRGYEPGTFYGDSALGAAFDVKGPEWALTSKLKVSPYAFYDAVNVWNKEPGIAQSKFVASAGAGLKMTYNRNVQLNLSYAAPLRDSPQGSSPRVLFSLTTAFGDVSNSIRDTLRVLGSTRHGK
jgi:hemolysin activation/secretion protein